jgi:hypothetical protein
MEQKVVRKLEEEIEDAVAEIVCRIALPAEAVRRVGQRPDVGVLPEASDEVNLL